MFNFLARENQETEKALDNGIEEFDIEEVEEVQNLDDFLDDTMVHAIYPFSWEEYPDHIESGSNYIRVLTIVDYPKVKSGNWLSELKRKKGNITIVQNFESSNSHEMVNYYNRAIKNKEAEKLDTYDPLKKKRINRTNVQRQKREFLVQLIQ